MRLLNSSTVQLEEFSADRIPAYAILSHTWQEEEVLFVDMERGRAEGKAGYQKTRNSCAQAAADGHHYIWIDTCCIDKRSSAELSEAINSMYSWYQQAEICYAYLADVPADVDTRSMDSAFARSRWFKRGWTLQELIGPSNLVFFSGDWVRIGTKSMLPDILSQITGIDPGVLTGEKDLESASVAQRMSWASNRATTRVEDIAYSLMGLFAVNMPMLYGEGEKAFIRLQEEIMKHSDDQSLFAWLDPMAHPDSYHGLLAKSPAYFQSSGNIVPYLNWEFHAPFSMSNKGLCIDLNLIHLGEGMYSAALDCPAPPDYQGFLGIYLVCLSSIGRQFARVRPQDFCEAEERSITRRSETVYVRQSTVDPGRQDIYSQHVFQLRHGPTRERGYEVTHVVAPFPNDDTPGLVFPSYLRSWIPTGMPFSFKVIQGTCRLAGALFLEHNDGERFAITLGLTTDFEVVFDVIAVSEIITFEQLEKSSNMWIANRCKRLGRHSVYVWAEYVIYLGVKHYIIDITVNVDPVLERV